MVRLKPNLVRVMVTINYPVASRSSANRVSARNATRPTAHRLLRSTGFMLVLWVALITLQARGQEMDMSSGAMDHSMHAGMPMEGGWRMVPMDPNMPMMPGMDQEVPPVAPYLPGAGHDISHFPTARPRQVVAMADGDTLTLRASLVRARVRGQEQVFLAYNEQIPGPLLKATQGSTVTVRFENAIESETTVHWHGLRHDYRYDGTPGFSQDPVAVGETFDYTLTFPDDGLFWYHPHVREDVQQDLGLAGNMLVAPTEPTLGAVNREVVLQLDDLLVDEQGLIPYGMEAPTHALMGRFGNVMWVNGQERFSTMARAGDVVRFYITNVANARTFNVVFEGADAKVVASDVSPFEREAFVESVPIAVAERYVVDVRYAEAGRYYITNRIQAINHFRGEFFPHVDTLAVVHVRGTTQDSRPGQDFYTAREHTQVQADIARYAPLFSAAPDHELELTLETDGLPLSIVRSMEIDTLYVPPLEWNDAMPMMNWVSTGKQVTWVLKDRATGRRNMAIDWSFQQGDVKKLRIYNNPRSFHPMNHPFHVHGQRFLVTHIDGVELTNKVWKDTATIPVGSTVDLLIEFSTPGRWMMHCHIAEHLSAGMMLGFDVIADPLGRDHLHAN